MTRVPPALAVALLAWAAPAPAAETHLAELQARARAEGLGAERPWLALLHFRGGKSEADGPAFFLSPRGKTDAAAELDADLAGFFAPPVEEPAEEGDGPGADRPQHPQCRFPARYAWLKERLAFDPARLPEQRCRRLEEWLGAIDADAATLVFADAFLNNPASMYGHTFLRLHRRGSRRGEDLLDYTINFAATPGTENAVLYAAKGLFGAFPGRFSTMPYYMKIQEYNNVESRDLWEYRFAWGPEKVDRLLRHAWEMGSTWFDYYFFDENCSYQILTLLEGAAPELRLAERFPIAVIPADTLRAVLGQPGLVAGARWRPSHVAEMRLRRERLRRGELRLATALGKGADPAAAARLAALPAARQALVLDSAHDLFRYRVGFDPDLPAEDKRVERRLLVRRGALGVPSPALEGIPRPAPPESGHASMRAGLGAGTSSLGPFQEVHFRGALHDLADDGSGYVPDHQLEMLDVRLRVSGGAREPRPGAGEPRPGAREAYPEKVDLVSLVSLSPLDPWIRRPSWTVSAGADQARELGCAGWSCAYAFLRGGAGLAAGTRLLGRETWYLLAEADLGAAPVLEAGWRGGGGPAGGLRVELGPRWRALVEASHFVYQAGPDRDALRLTQAVGLTRGLELRAILERRPPVSEASLAALAYF